MLSGDHQLVAPPFRGRALSSATNETNTLARDLSYAVAGDGRRRGIARTRGQTCLVALAWRLAHCQWHEVLACVHLTAESKMYPEIKSNENYSELVNSI